MSEFVWPVRVYYEDTDSGGVVYYANYLKFMERARTEWLRALGFEQTVLAAAHGVMFVVRRATVEYLRPARFNDELSVASTVKRFGQCRIVFAQNIVRDSLLASGETEVACVSSLSFKPVKIPDTLLQALEQLA
ncbi:tol-pal system-associated acyl-CoA thioesterase [Sulfuriferula plumbiphila]|uniref:Tol-pal system-associated acyl-CoA thioesterase n=1 Tax=Sulfuriferula plumbiphila TaxID=171865 RepID=A0A512LAR3_9PROT|nr:tol-pal system-associated acyl-CoA thioesterase [Sulfuriferula plumbiphila]BBP03345.1 tol-pal system-associated acyl-CoA thioesterase [Sulfuriferula plumbiphila]GEP31573.1 tol-pal system-associated acyl-CoA thioesterase [Sulfuriferula plumbiphila]